MSSEKEDAGGLALVDPGTGATLNSAASKFNMDGVIGGGQIGYNWQSGRWVFGLETDFQGANQKGGMSSLCAGGTFAVQAAPAPEATSAIVWWMLLQPFR